MAKRRQKPETVLETVLETVPCSSCNGSGRVELNGVYTDTLILLRAVNGEIHGAELARQDGCNPTAMNNRLAYLVRHGFAVERPYGRKKFYRAV